jgi:NADPH2:quinone reductase
MTAFQCLEWHGQKSVDGSSEPRRGQDPSHDRLPPQQQRTILFHAGASGVGLAACQWGTWRGHRMLATCSTVDKAAACRSAGATPFIVQRQLPAGSTSLFADAIRKWHADSGVVAATNGGVVDLIVDPVFGAQYFAENTQLLNTDGGIVVLSFLQGPKLPAFDATSLFSRRAWIKFSTLRSQSDEYKAALVSDFVNNSRIQQTGQIAASSAAASPRPHAFQPGGCAPNICATMPIEDVAKAHDILEKNATTGKVLLTM